MCHYFFRTREAFEQLIAENRLLEYAEYNGNYYGTPEDAIKGWLNEGKNVLLEIEVQGGGAGAQPPFRLRFDLYHHSLYC